MFLVYKITNLINQKVYVGVHKTNNINDSYMGSGSGIKAAISKYGKRNFTKTIIKICDSYEEMFLLEASIVNEAFVKDRNTYNRKVGGFGGFDHLNDHSPEHISRSSRGGKIGILKMQETVKRKCAEDPEYKAFISNKCRQSFLGKKHTPETKKIISENSKIKQSGSRNSQFGTMWITHHSLSMNKKIKKNELSAFEKDGWIKGRKTYIAS